MEKIVGKIKYDENTSPPTLLPVDRLTSTDCNTRARAKSLVKVDLALFFLSILDLINM